jgi:uncharacterized membrane protein
MKKPLITATSLAGIFALLSLTDFTIAEAAKFTLLGFFYGFLPGFAISLFLIKESSLVERIAVSIGLSLAILPLPNLFASLLGFYIFPSAQFAAIILLFICARIHRRRNEKKHGN